VGAAVQMVVALSTKQNVGTFTTAKTVIALATVNDVFSAIPEDAVITLTA
jgi:hypothetical protein